ncbi:MAG: hypothetical protein ABI689_02690 [Thermoanaerobaculia bacterium]
MPILKPAATYFALVFGAGFLLGALRVTLVVPRIGARTAELVETPLMLLVCAAAAAWVLRRYPEISSRGASLATGMLAVGFLLVAEFGVGVAIMHLPPERVFVKPDPVLALAFYGALALTALLPFLLRWRR